MALHKLSDACCRLQHNLSFASCPSHTYTNRSIPTCCSSSRLRKLDSPVGIVLPRRSSATETFTDFSTVQQPSACAAWFRLVCPNNRDSSLLPISSPPVVGQELTPPTSEHARGIDAEPECRSRKIFTTCFRHVLRRDSSNHGGSTLGLRCEWTLIMFAREQCLSSVFFYCRWCFIGLCDGAVS